MLDVWRRAALLLLVLLFVGAPRHCRGRPGSTRPRPAPLKGTTASALLWTVWICSEKCEVFRRQSVLRDSPGMFRMTGQGAAGFRQSEQTRVCPKHHAARARRSGGYASTFEVVGYAMVRRLILRTVTTKKYSMSVSTRRAVFAFTPVACSGGRTAPHVRRVEEEWTFRRAPPLFRRHGARDCRHWCC